MDDKAQLEIQAFLDGELPEKKAREMAALVARDAEASELLTELRNTRQAVAVFEPERRLPESREFDWSKIEQAIRKTEPVAEPTAPVPIFAWLRRFLVPAGAVAALALCVTVAVVQSGVSGHPEMETTFSDSGAFTYHDDANGTTLVWLSYPAEREFADDTAH
jgi:anti-sigma factor RsiW